MFHLFNRVTKNIHKYRLKLYLYLFILVYATYIVYCAITKKTEIEDPEQYSFGNKEKYLINTPGCRIEYVDPLSPEIQELLYKVRPISCSDKHLLTYISKYDNIVTLNINKSVANEYSLFNIKCCYMNVTRNLLGPDPDDNLNLSECTYFQDSVHIEVDVVKVECSNIFHKVYENVHATFKQPSKVQNIHDPNIILIGIDGVSMSNFIRTMPRTHQLLEETGWINLKGYNKVEDNTFPNIIAILAGVKFSYHDNYAPENCNPYKADKLQECNFLWKTFKRNNYSTAYAEDTPKIGTFNSNKAGFVSPPTDYYFRPYFLTAEQLTPQYLCLKPHCTGPEKTGIRMQNLITGFLDAIKGKTPGFGLFWMNTFSHEDVNCPTSMDDDFEVYFKGLTTNGYLDNTIMIFFSDHGFRFGKIRLTPTGWLEERLPFIYIWIPENFRKSYTEEYHNLVENSEKLTSPYDIYMTLQDVLSLSNPSFKPEPADGCPKCHSLLKRVPSERTCNAAGIPDHYCTCSKYEKMDKNLPIVKKLGLFFVNELNKIIRSVGSVSKGCAVYYLEKISNAKHLTLMPGLEENYLIGIITNPEANFEGTVKVVFKNNSMDMSLKEINRLDRYAPTSYCVQNSRVQMYCYCKNTLKRLTNIFCNNKYCFL